MAHSARFARPALLVLVLLPAVLLSPRGVAELPVTLGVTNLLPEARSRAPLTWGVPFAVEDALLDPASLTLLSGDSPIPFQARVEARWGGRPADTSRPISWLLVDTALDLAASETLSLRLVRAPRATATGPLRVARDDASGVTVETGAATYVLSKTAFRIFDRVALAGGPTFEGGGGISFRGTRLSGPATIAVEEAGPFRITLRVQGALAGSLGFTMRIHFYRDLAETRVETRVENLTDYSWRDGQPDCNDYGSPGSVAFGDLSLAFPAAGRSFRYPSGERGAGPETTGTFASTLSLVQESSGEARWDALRSEAPRLQSGVRKRASTVTLDGAVSDGPDQLGGWLDAGGVTVAIPDFWQSFPKALRARDGSVEAGLFPGEYARDHELRAGEMKTHTVWVRHHADGVGDVAGRARSSLSPLRLLPPPETVARTRAAGLFAPRQDALFPAYEAGVNAQVVEAPGYAERPWESAAPTLQASISLSQLYGWVDWGDVPTDFEPFGPDPALSSPWNHKYETLRGWIQQALRSGNETWWTLAAAGARHAADIDVLHSRRRGLTGERFWPDGGIYGHGYHDERGNTNPHRNYMNTSVSMTSQPAGMFLWALLSGDAFVLDSAVEAADSVLWKVTRSAYLDDGGCAATLRRCSTGDPWTCDGWEEADGNRTGANVVKTLLAAFEATGEPSYLDVVGALASYLDCDEGRRGVCCNRHHLRTMTATAMGHYLLVRRAAGLPEDLAARSFLRRRVDYMAGVLWNASARTFSMCYLCDNDPDWEDCDESVMCAYDDNWLLSAADAYGAAALALGDTTILRDAGRPVFDIGSLHPMGYDSTLAYHFTKEMANQVGFGGTFLHAWSLLQAGCSLSCTASAVADGRTVRYTGTSTATGCAGAPTWRWTFGDGTTSSEQSPSHTYASDGTWAWTATASAEGQSCQRSGSVTVGSPQAAWRYVVPAAAHSTGAFGSTWQTDLAAVNLAGAAAAVSFTFVPAESTALTGAGSVPAGGTHVWNDVLSALFGAALPQKASGSLHVASDQPLALSSRTFNMGDDGTFGGFLPAVTPARCLTRGRTGYLLQLRRSTAYRTNVGLSNLGTAPGEVAVLLRGASGQPLGSEVVVTVPAGGLVQIDDVFGSAGAGDQPLAYAELTVRTEGVPVWAYASVIDNGTSDPTIVPLMVR